MAIGHNGWELMCAEAPLGKMDLCSDYHQIILRGNPSLIPAAEDKQFT